MSELHGPTHEGSGGEGAKGLKGLTGKKLSLPLVGGIVVVGGILAFVMMRHSSGGAVAGTASQTNAAATNSAGDIAALSQQIQGIQSNSSNMFSDLAAKFAAGQKATPTPTTPSFNAKLITKARFGLQQGDTGPPVYGAHGELSGQMLPWGSDISILGGPNSSGLYPISGPGGTTSYVSPVDIGSWMPTRPATGVNYQDSFPIYPGRGAGVLLASGPTANA